MRLYTLYHKSGIENLRVRLEDEEIKRELNGSFLDFFKKITLNFLNVISQYVCATDKEKRLIKNIDEYFNNFVKMRENIEKELKRGKPNWHG